MLNKADLKAVLNQFTSLRDMLRWSLTQFYQANLYYGHGTDNAWDEALYLALSALHLPPNVNPAVLDARLLETERAAIIKLVQRRITERIPAAYLTQQAWFAGLSFYVDQRVIIPRSPLAELIEKGFEPWVQAETVGRILDLCTGSGCIAIACAANLPQANVDAVDVSSQALEVAQMNVNHHHMQNQVRLIHADLFTGIPGQIYDVIVSNPPYVGKAELLALPAEYQHEPQIALAGGNTDGLDVVIRILQQAEHHLSPEGVLIVEVGNSQQALIERFPEVAFVWLEFERGGDGVFLLTADQLLDYKNMFRQG